MTDNTLLEPHTDISTDINTDISTEVWSLSYTEKATKALLRTWREYPGIGSYEASELYLSNDAHDIEKLFFPIPWYDKEFGDFRLMEVTLIHHPGKLDPETKDRLRKKAMKLRPPDPRRIHDSYMTFIFCNSKGETRTAKSRNNPCFTILKGTKSGYAFYKCMANTLEKFVNGFEEKLPKIYRRTAKVIEFDKAYSNRLKELKTAEIKEMNRTGRTTNMSVIATPDSKLAKLLEGIQ